MLGGRLLATMLAVSTMLVKMRLMMLVKMLVRMLVFVPPAKGKTIHTLLPRFLL